MATGKIIYRAERRKWTARYYEYDPVAGKEVTRSKDFKTQEEAKKYLATKMYQKEDPSYIEHHGIPLGEMMRTNLRLKLKTNQITEVTYHRSLKTIEQIEKFPIGTKNIDEITAEELQEFMNYHTYLSNSSIKKLYQQFGTTFKIAINKGYIMRNPMINVLRPRSEKLDKKVRALTYEEQQEFTNYLMNRDISECMYKNVFLIQMFMGLRISEALALTTHDIDLKNKKIKISRTLTKDEIGRTIMGRTTKTYAGQRTVPIPDFLVDTIMDQMRHAKNQDNNEEELLFKPDYREYADRENANHELRRILKKYLGIEDITTHSLRHTYGTRCIESGMAPVVVQRLMGHTDIGVTLNTYTSVYDEFKQKEVDKVNNYYLSGNMINSNPKLKGAEDDELEL